MYQHSIFHYLAFPEAKGLIDNWFLLKIKTLHALASGFFAYKKLSKKYYAVFGLKLLYNLMQFQIL